jgi:hypothetical protein
MFTYVRNSFLNITKSNLLLLKCNIIIIIILNNFFLTFKYICIYLYFKKIGKSIFTIFYLLIFLYKYNKPKIEAVRIES